MKTDGIPLWITLLLGLSVVLGIVAGGLALTGNGMEAFMGPSWGGRNMGLGLAALAAIWLKSPTAYIAVFLGAMAREVGDIVELSQLETPNWPVVIFAAALLVVWVIGITQANKARHA